MKNIPKNDQKDFYSQVMELLKEYGATESNYGSYAYILDTELGNYHLKIYDFEETSVYSIFGRFEDIKAAKKVIDCNPYSGKYNFHSFDKQTILNDFTRFLSMFAWKQELTF